MPMKRYTAEEFLALIRQTAAELHLSMQEAALAIERRDIAEARRSVN